MTQDSKNPERRQFLSTTAGAISLSIMGCGGGGGNSANALPSSSAAPVVIGSTPGSTTTTTPPSTTPAHLYQLPNPTRGYLQSSAAATDQAWTTGLAFAQSEVPRGITLSSTSHPSFQAVVKNRWPDGSIKFAIASGLCSLSAGQRQAVDVLGLIDAAMPADTPAPAPSLTETQLLGTGLRASLGFGSVGQVELRELIGKTATLGSNGRWSGGRVRTWISGPVMSSWIYAAHLGNDPHLMAWFEVRYYRNGAIHVLPWVENGFLKVPGCTGHVQTLTLSLNGSSRFNMQVHLANHCRVVALDGAGSGHWLDATQEAVVALPDTERLQASRLVPHYFAQTPASSPAMQRIVARFNPSVYGQVPTRNPGGSYNGLYPANMGTAGYHLSIGLLPEWDVLYLTTGGNTQTWHSAVHQALGAGRYPIHDRDESTLRPLRFSQHATLGLGTGGGPRGVSSVGVNRAGNTTPPVTAYVSPSGSSLTPETWATSHHPSIGYMAYLLTGQMFHLESAQFSATLSYLKQVDDIRQNDRGLLLTTTGANTTRGAAWSFRSTLQAAAATPDDDELRGEFVRVLEHNVSYYHERYSAPASASGAFNPGICTPYVNYTPNLVPPVYHHASWMEDFLTAAFGWMRVIEVMGSSEANSRLDAFFRWKAQSVVGRLGPVGKGDTYGYTRAGVYTLAVAPANTESGWPLSGPWFNHWGDVFSATNGISNSSNQSNRLTGGNFPFATGYWGNMLPALAFAVELGAPGAREAYARLTGGENWPEFIKDAHNSPVWSVAPPSSP